MVNEFVYHNIAAVDIDEEGTYKPANYEAKVKKFTIIIKMKDFHNNTESPKKRC